LRQIRHQALAAAEIVQAGPGRVAIISEAGDSSLAARMRECQAAGQPGIPRSELLAHLARAAHALDQIYHVHQVQHLALSPRNLALGRGELLVLEFGLAELVWLPLGQPPASLNPRYAAVELFDGLISDACDQYSLALIYQELLVGLHPFRNLNARQLASSKLRGQPDLGLLPALDRAVVSQALAPEPEKRFRSCREFIMALEEATLESETAQGRSMAATRVMPAPGAAALAPAWLQALDELIGLAARGQEVRSSGALHYRLLPGVEAVQHAWARLAPGMARLKISSFREQWQAEVLEHGNNRWLLDVRTPGNLLQRCLGRMPGLLVEVVLGSSSESAGHSSGHEVPVRIRLEPVDCGRGKGAQVLTELGPAVLAALQTHLGIQCTRQAQERYPLAQPVHVHSRNAGLSVTGRLRDVGREGLSLLTPCPLPVGSVTVTLTRWASTVQFQVPGWARDCRPVGDKLFEVEVRLGG
jgi:hypothetical protein